MGQEADRKFYDELVMDGELVASFGRYAGTFKDDEFFRVLGDVQALAEPDRNLRNESIVRLQQLLNDNVGLVPFTTLSRLKEGWRPDKVRWRRLWNLPILVMIVLTVFLMLLTVKLTLVYDRGLSIVSGLQAIESSDPTRRYRQLIRDLALAHEQGDAMQTGDPTLEVLSQAYANFYAIEAELGALSAEMKDAFDESTGFMRREVVFPFWGMNPAFCGLSDLLRWLRGEVASGAGESGVEAAWGPDEAYYTFYCAHAPTASQQAAPGTRSPSTTGAGTATPSRDIAALPNFERFETAMDVEARRLLADGIIPFLPGQEPPLARLAKSIGDALMPYSRWLLPSLYGSLGALVYHMRLIVDPLRPNPRPSRLLHYVALGGLAGVILTWLLTPGSLFADRVAVLGLNLFVVAFLFGYNLDSFFSTLDRYVALSADASRRPPSARVAATLSSDRTGSQQQTPPAAT